MIVHFAVLFLTMHPEVTEETLKSVNCVMSGSAPLGALDEQRFLEKAKKDMNILQGKNFWTHIIITLLV